MGHASHSLWTLHQGLEISGKHTTVHIAAIIGVAHNTMQSSNTLRLMSKSMQVNPVVTSRQQRALSRNDEPGDRQALAMKRAAQRCAHTCGCCYSWVHLQVSHGVPRGLPVTAYASSTSLQCAHMVKSAKFRPSTILTEPE